MNTTINASLVKALSELTNLAKDKVNPHFKSRFTSLDAILDATRSVLAKHGLALSQEPVFEDGMAGVVTRIIHTSGESRESKLILPLRDQSAQGVGSAISYARRYSAAAVLGIASDEDDDGQQASTPSKAITRAVIAKPVINKPDNSLDTLFGLMDTNKVSEEEIRSFCLSKGMKDVPEFVADLKESVAKRLVEIFSEVIEYSLSK
jgi:threonine dehydrogenase-like Zn-dependent dehydrogenase